MGNASMGQSQDTEQRGKGKFQAQITEEHPQDAEELQEVGMALSSIPEPQGCSEQAGALRGSSAPAPAPAAAALLPHSPAELGGLPEPPLGCQNQIKAGKFWQRSSEWERTRRQRCHGYEGII